MAFGARTGGTRWHHESWGCERRRLPKQAAPGRRFRCSPGASNLRRWWASPDKTVNWAVSLPRVPTEQTFIRQATELLNGPMSLECVANELGYQTRSAFGRAFRERVGCSPTKWRKDRGVVRAPDLRIAEAEALLLAATGNMRTVARLAGFSSPQAMANAFRAKHNMSPTEWLHSHRRVRVEIVAVPDRRSANNKV